MRFQGRRFKIASPDASSIASIVSETTTGLGFILNRTDSPDHSIKLICAKKASWHQFVLLGVIQRVEWTIAPDAATGTTTIEYDRRWSAWFRVMIIVLAIPVGFAWYNGFRTLIRVVAEPASSSLFSMVAPWVGIFGMMIYARTVVTATDSVRYLDHIRTRLRHQGLVLDTLPLARRDRFTWTSMALLAYGLVGAGAAVATAEWPPGNAIFTSHVWAGIVVLLLIAFLVFAGIALGIAIKWSASDDRFAGLMPSMSWMLAIFFLHAGVLPFYLYRTIPPDFWPTAFQARELAQQGEALQRANPSYETARASYDRSWKILLLPAILTPATWFIALSFGYASLKGATIALRTWRRLHTDAAGDSVRASTAGAGFLKLFQLTYSGMWFLFVALYTIGFGLVVRVLVDFSADPTAANNSAQATINVVAFLAGIEQDSEVLAFGFRGLVVVWAAFIPGAVILSVAELARTSWRRRCRLKTARSLQPGTAAHDLLGVIVDDLKGRMGALRPRILISDDHQPVAVAHHSVFHRRLGVVEISTGTMELLEPRELRAIVAHELAHHLCGHCQRYTLLHWLGRFTLVGDAFVGTLMNSFGYEIEADRVAVDKLGIAPVDLRDALLNMQIAAMLGVPRDRSEEPVSRDPQSNADVAKPKHDTFRSRIRAWIALYTGNPPLAYWHPTVGHRLQALQELG